MEKAKLKRQIEELCSQAGKKLKVSDLPARFGDIPAKEIGEALDELFAEGKLMLSAKKRIMRPGELGLTYARVQATGSGHAFLVSEGREKDALLTGNSGALHGDAVLATIKDRPDGRFVGTVESILVHANGTVIGTMETGKGGDCIVVPGDQRIHARLHIPASGTAGAAPGDQVVAEVEDWDAPYEPQARIVEVLGKSGDSSTQLRAIIRSHGLEEKFSDAALEEARALPKHVTAKARKGREDFTDQPCVTIDGETAKDFDDAVYAQEIPGGYRLHVHIADVSHYVRPHSPIDRDAYDRATSVYLLSTVLPMLPEELSNGICSLMPGEPRLAFSCIMDIDKSTGDVTDYRLSRSVICSHGRLTYTDVTALLEGDDAAREKLGSHGELLGLLERLAAVLAARRDRRGSIDFNLPEADIRLDGEGRAVSVEAAERGVSNRIIEECMLLANEVVAQHAVNLDLPFLYRVHGEPGAEKIKAYAALATNLGYALKVGKHGVHPKHLQALLGQAKGRPEETMLSTLMLRSMQRARYDARNQGHFGLALKDYCHFTSPIRRYPDLFIHRVLGMQLAGELDEDRGAELAAFAPEAAAHCSERETAASGAEMDWDSLKKAEYMSAHVGESFEGVVSGAIATGFFVDLPNTVSGMVPLRSLTDDSYALVEGQYCIKSRRTGHMFRLGDKVLVRCESVDVEQWKIEFSVAE